MTFEKWLMKNYYLTLELYKLESEYIRNLLLGRYEDYRAVWGLEENA
ncbi:hypothetical protein [Jeotgalibaca porci]